MSTMPSAEPLQYECIVPPTEPAQPGEFAAAQYVSLHRLRPLKVEELLAGVSNYEELVEFEDEQECSKITIRPGTMWFANDTRIATSELESLSTEDAGTMDALQEAL